MNNCEKQEWIDNYLFGELEGQERRDFERLMEHDVDFCMEVNLQAEIMLGVCTYREAKQSAKAKLMPRKTITAFKRYWMTAAAVLAAFLLLEPTEPQHIQTTPQITDNRDYYQKVMPYQLPFPAYRSRGYTELALN